MHEPAAAERRQVESKGAERQEPRNVKSLTAVAPGAAVMTGTTLPLKIPCGFSAAVSLIQHPIGHSFKLLL